MVSGIIDMVHCCFAVGALTVRIQYLTDHMKRNKKVMGSSVHTLTYTVHSHTLSCPHSHTLSSSVHTNTH